MKYIITIGREYGSGGRFIGQELAKRLKIKFYDSNLLKEVAKNSGLDINYIKANEEQKESIFSFLGASDNSSFLSASTTVSLAQFDTIKELAKKESFVIVGRCSDYILKDQENLINIFIHAPMKNKIERCVKYYKIKEEEAKSIINKMDKKRASYYNFYTDQKWGFSDNYDLSISSALGVEKTVDVIEQFVKIKLGI